MDQQELNKALKLHRKWLRDEEGSVRLSLYRANLTRADLTEANLTGADLTRADLTGANLTEIKNLPPFQLCPEEGNFIGWKTADDAILKLLIPSCAKRISTPIGRKCRTNRAVVLAAFDLDGNPIEQTEFPSNHDGDFVYRIGQLAECPDLDEDIRCECTKGLHFWLTRREAEEWARM